MREYLIKRFFLLIPTFIGITLVVYLTFRTLFRSSAAILAEPPEARGERVLYGQLQTL